MNGQQKSLSIDKLDDEKELRELQRSRIEN